MSEIKWWGYRHINGTIHAKRFFSQEDLSEAVESPFVADIVAPFVAKSRDEALTTIAHKLGGGNARKKDVDG